MMKHVCTALICLTAYGTAAHADGFDSAGDMQALSAGELAGYRGGYTLPNGLEINVGVSVQSSVNGDVLAATSPSLGAAGNLVPIASSASVQLSGQQQVQTFVQAATAGSSPTIQNALNNSVIQQLTEVNVDVNNYAHLESAAAASSALSALTGLMHQSAVGGLH